MNPDRRRFIEILSVGGVGSLAGCSLFELNAGEESTSKPDDTSTSDESQAEPFDTSSRVKSALASRRDRHPTPEFSYEPVSTQIESSDLFSQVRARPAADENGDYLQLQPATRSATELASLLRDLWNVETTLTATRTGEETEVRFAGGEAFGTTYLVGTAQFDAATVVAVRASTPDVATELAELGPFPLEV